MNMRNLIIAVIVVLLLTIAAPALAQDTEPPAAPVVVELPAALQTLLEWLNNTTFIAGLAFGVPVFVSVIKFLFSLAKVEISGGAAVLVSLAVQVVVWLAYNLALNRGAETVFVDWYTRIVQAIDVLWPLVAGMLGSHLVYQKSKDSGFVLTGYRGYRKPNLTMGNKG